jgi:5'-3' exoribonuclease 2
VSFLEGKILQLPLLLRVTMMLGLKPGHTCNQMPCLSVFSSLTTATMYSAATLKAASFDSNVITPGTEFMERLAQYLEYYVVERLSSDPAWKDVTVILSDASVPGEGEHKIMDFIRRQRAAPDHDPNLRHVLYGADADLLMLGLASHEPYFTILREEFRPSTKKPCDLCTSVPLPLPNTHCNHRHLTGIAQASHRHLPIYSCHLATGHHRGHKRERCPGLPALKEDGTAHENYGWGDNKARKRGPKFLFVELAILREALGKDLGYLNNSKTPSKESRQRLERMIDDWIFICFFVGNDFLCGARFRREFTREDAIGSHATNGSPLRSPLSCRFTM